MNVASSYSIATERTGEPFKLIDHPRGTPENRPMRDTSKPANAIRQDKVVITHSRTPRNKILRKTHHDQLC